METCPICLEILGENITTTNCNHIFCNSCFDELMDNNRIECPLCRGIIKGYLNNVETFAYQTFRNYGQTQ